MAKKSDAVTPVMATPSMDAQSMKMPMAKIVVDWKKNSRQFKSEASIKRTAESFKKQGQITPVRLSPRADGKYDLVSGYTRYEAAKSLGWETIDATVSTSVLSNMQRLVENVVENEQRKDLTPYEQAYAYKALSEEKDEKGKELTQQAIAGIAGKSQSYVSRLITATEVLHPKVLEQWKKDCEAIAEDDTHTPIVTVQSIKSLAKATKEEQLEWLDRQINGEPETDEEGDGEGSDDEKGVDTTPRMSMANIKRALAAAEQAEKDATNVSTKEYARGVVNALKFAIKDGKGIEGVCKYKKGEEGKGGKVVTLKGEGIAAPRGDGKATIQPSA